MLCYLVETVINVQCVWCQMCVYIENMERVAAGLIYSQICVYIQNIQTVAAVINIQSDMCVYTEYTDGTSCN